MVKLKKRKPVKKIRKKILRKSLVKKPAQRRKVLVKKMKKRNPKPKIKIPRRRVKKAVKRRTSVVPAVDFAAESLFKAKIKVIGVGGGGGSIVSEIGRSLEKATFVIADTDTRALRKDSGIKYFFFGQEITHGLGTGVNVDIAKAAAESAKEKISSIFKDQDIIIFVASLGGGLGSGATQVFADEAKKFGGITFGIFTMPFRFEGKNKQRIAQNALRYLRQSLNVSLVIPNEKIFKIIGESTPITTAFSTINKNLIESLESLIDLIYNPGIINIDFADLRAILRGRGNTAFLNTVEESGKNRVEKTCEKIFKNPLLQNIGLKSEKVLFNIAGSDSLSMFEVEKISSHISCLNHKAKIIFGISRDNKLKNKIKTTILMTSGHGDATPLANAVKLTPAKKPEPIKAEASEKTKEILKETKPDKKKKTPVKKHAKKPAEKPKEKILPENKDQKRISSIPVFEVPIPTGRSVGVSFLEPKAEAPSVKKMIRRSGLEIKKAEELQEKKRLAQEKEWEIPAFLRKVKFTRSNDR